ncbi:WD40 repeat domain-containing protein [Paenibacillus campi]|uniref:WD40 repeat domain-containing protein n=1 Tax=Paenibacillus campi TaxID=3106031 RepID=UPI002AFEFD11|nr:WD40 repeat domain-containing protein [Paenibacillus sp. SGZ-1014]
MVSRINRMSYNQYENVILAGDTNGQVHKYDLDLNLIMSSPATGYSAKIICMTTNDKYVITKNKYGGLAKWDLKTLHPLDVLDEFYLRDEDDLMEDEEPSPSNARGINIYNGHIYCSNGYGQNLVVDIETFRVVEFRKTLTEGAFIDCVNVELPDLHAIGTTEGTVFLGDIEKNSFPVQIKADGGNIHVIKHDQRHDRFVATQDYGLGENANIQCGIVTFDKQGENVKNHSFTFDDVEDLAFDHDYKTLYAGGFDCYLYVFDNTYAEPSLKHVYGPFAHQIKNIVYLSEEQIYCLLQSGEIVQINAKGEIQTKNAFVTKCIWDMKPHPTKKDTFYCGKDDGVQIFSVKSDKHGVISMQSAPAIYHGFGLINAIRPLPDDSYIAISRTGKKVFRARPDGTLIWNRDVLGMPREVNLNQEYSKLLLCTDKGYVYELDVENGNEQAQFNFNSNPVFSTGYTSDGRRIVGFKNGVMHVYDAQKQQLLATMELTDDMEYPKRWLGEKDGFHYIVGAFGLLQLDLDAYEIKKQWLELIYNTKENAVIVDDYVYVLGYGEQMGVYHFETGEMVDLLEHFLDYPKAISTYRTEDGSDVLFVGGRGNYVNVYKLEGSQTLKIREYYLN